MTSHDYLAVGCFGKLPFDREYLEVNVALPSSKALRAWIRDGRTIAGMSPDSQDGTVPPETNRLRCLVSPAGSQDVLAAVLRPSADLGGRVFPFAVFAHVPRRPWSRSFHLMPMALDPVWDALDDAWDSLASVASERAFREILASAAIPGPASPAEVKVAYEAGQSAMAGRLFQRGDGASLDALLANLPALLKELKSSPADVRLELPTSSAVDEAAFDAAFWVDLVNRQFFWKRFEPTLFLDGAPTRPDRRLFALFGDLAAEDYAGTLGLQGAASRFSRPAHAAHPVPATGSDASAATPTYAELAAMRFVA